MNNMENANYKETSFSNAFGGLFASVTLIEKVFIIISLLTIVMVVVMPIVLLLTHQTPFIAPKGAQGYLLPYYLLGSVIALIAGAYIGHRVTSLRLRGESKHPIIFILRALPILLILAYIAFAYVVALQNGVAIPPGGMILMLIMAPASISHILGLVLSICGFFSVAYLFGLYRAWRQIR